MGNYQCVQSFQQPEQDSSGSSDHVLYNDEEPE